MTLDELIARLQKLRRDLPGDALVLIVDAFTDLPSYFGGVESDPALRSPPAPCVAIRNGDEYAGED